MFHKVFLALREGHILIVLVNCRAFQLLRFPTLIRDYNRKLLNPNAQSDSLAFLSLTCMTCSLGSWVDRKKSRWLNIVYETGHGSCKDQQLTIHRWM